MSTTPKATERLTLTLPPRRAKKGEKIIHVATPNRASAISLPMASAISRPLNHFTIPRLTVIPAISTPQPKIIKPHDANLAEAGIPAAKGRMSSHLTPKSGPQLRWLLNHASRPEPMNDSLIAYHLTIAPTSIRAHERTIVKRTPILSRMMPAKIRKKAHTLRKTSEPCIRPNDVESHPRSESIKSLMGERMSMKM